MKIAERISRLMGEEKVTFELIDAAVTTSTPRGERLPEAKLAKAVLLKHRGGYLLAVTPYRNEVDPNAVEMMTGHRCEPASADEIPSVFDDCRIEAVPPMGDVYGVPTLVHDSLMLADDVYFEAGDPQHLVHVDREGFCRLMGDARGGNICRPA
jgi:Ala-tRNA(Pro) deacylase